MRLEDLLHGLHQRGLPGLAAVRREEAPDRGAEDGVAVGRLLAVLDDAAEEVPGGVAGVEAGVVARIDEIGNETMTDGHCVPDKNLLGFSVMDLEIELDSIANSIFGIGV